VTLLSRKEAYLVDSYYSRGVRGERSDVLTIVDMTDLTTEAEIALPPRTATLRIRGHIGLLGDERHVVVFNMTPAQSVSVVDVVARKFVGEISTPGCAVIMPSGPRAFLMLCGDGTLQLVELDESGQEARRARSKPFFEVDKDPVFDSVLYTGSGWLLVTYDGLVREAGVEDGRIRVGESWSMLNAEDREEGGAREQWRPGGWQPFSLHRGTSLLYALMHKGKVDTPVAGGTELWVFDVNRRKRVGRLKLPVEATNVLASQESSPRLYLYDKDNKLQIYDGRLLKLQRTVEKPGAGGPLMQTLGPYD
jgi:methylamine dehydrogenase heavy chain